MGIPVMLQDVNIATQQQLAAKLVTAGLTSAFTALGTCKSTPMSLNAIFLTGKE